MARSVASRVAYGYNVDWSEIERLLLAAQRLANASIAAGIDEHDRASRDRLARHREKLAEAA